MKLIRMLYFTLIVLLIADSSLGADVLVVGDSHNVGPFGEALYKGLHEELDLEVLSIGLAGASGTTWSSGKDSLRTLKAGYSLRSQRENLVVAHGNKMTVPRLGDLLKKEKVKVLVVELGDNFAGYSSPVPDSYVKNQVTAVLKQMESVTPAPRCFWITPIWTDKESVGTYKKTNQRLYQVNRLIKEAAGNRCTVIDSTKDLDLKKEDIKVLSDGIHFGSTSGKRWGQAAAQKISTLLRKSTPQAPSRAGAQ